MTILTLMLFLDPSRIAGAVPIVASSPASCFAKLDDLKRIDFGGEREPAVTSFDPQKLRDLLPVRF